MKPLLHSLAFLTIAATMAASVQADSLFPGSSTAVGRTNAASVSLFSDNKARHVGDTLTIVINENASTTSQATTKNSKNETLSYGPRPRPDPAQHPCFRFERQYRQQCQRQHEPDG